MCSVNNTTLVTCFYPVKSKFTVDTYLDWATKYMRLKAPIVLFTDISFVDIFLEMRGNLPIHIITQPFEEIYMYANYKDKWAEQYEINKVVSDRFNLSEKLFALWSNKSVWVVEAIQNNPFNTEFFMWVDLGVFRDGERTISLVENLFPNHTFFPKDKLIFSSIDDLKIECHNKRDDIFGFFNYPDTYLAGNIWGGGISACVNFREKYEIVLNKYFILGRDCSNDQYPMLSTILEYRDLGVVLKPARNIDVDIWFSSLYILSGLADYEINLTYHK